MMITTLCLNPSFDRTVQVDSMTVGGTNRIRAARTDAGGKGVNVLRVCRRLGAEARCVMLAGEENAPLFRQMMAAEGLTESLAVVAVPGAIRTNTKIVSRDGKPVTELNEAGPAADASALVTVADLLAAQQEDWLILTGSLPPGCPKGTYGRLMGDRGDRCILDVGGEELLLGLKAHPYLIKPNVDELSSAVGRPLTGTADILVAARQLMTMGAQNVLVSMGGDGAMLVTPQGAWIAPAVPVRVSSTVGAGDAMVGGLMSLLEKGAPLLECFRMAVACGTASVMTDGTQLIRVEDAEAILPRVVIRECGERVL